MSYHAINHFAQSWGVFLLLCPFLAACAYALWPANRDTFKRAAAKPLEEDPQ